MAFTKRSLNSHSILSGQLSIRVPFRRRCHSAESADRLVGEKHGSFEFLGFLIIPDKSSVIKLFYHPFESPFVNCFQIFKFATSGIFSEGFTVRNPNLGYLDEDPSVRILRLRFFTSERPFAERESFEETLPLLKPMTISGGKWRWS